MAQFVQGEFKSFRQWETNTTQPKKFGMPPAFPPIAPPFSYRTPPLGEFVGNYPNLAMSPNYRFNFVHPLQTQFPTFPHILPQSVPSEGLILGGNSVRMQQIGVLPYIHPYLVPIADQVVYRDFVRRQQTEFLQNIPGYLAPLVGENTSTNYLGGTTTRVQANIIKVNVHNQREKSLRRSRNFSSLRNNVTLSELEEILPYQPQKARKFPAKDRTVEEQLRRDRNTIACRKSRRLKRLNTNLSKY